MTEPEKDELEEDRHHEVVARLIEMKQSVDGMREQNSHEHGSIFSKLLHLTEVVHWLRAVWGKFVKNVPDPPEKPPFK